MANDFMEVLRASVPDTSFLELEIKEVGEGEE